MADDVPNPSCSDVQPETSPSSDEKLDGLIKAIMKSVSTAVKVANDLPKIGDNYELYSSYPAFSQIMKLEGIRSLELLSKTLRHAGIKMNFQSESLDDEERVERLIDANDTLLERAGTALDEAAGLRKKQESVILVAAQKKNSIITTSWNRYKGLAKSSTISPQSEKDRKIHDATVRLLASRNIVRPQLKIAGKVDNTNTKFQAKLTHKHNAKRVWKGNMTIFVDDEEQSLEEGSSRDQERHSHPYQYELSYFEPLEKCLQIKHVQEPRPLDETPLVFITNAPQLERLCAMLKTEECFAVDIEHHSYRSFQGITCLIQISTREKDFIIDPFEIWTDLQMLNDPFTDPAIVKVFHGAEKDVEWLQRDFGIYVVNMFDTGQAMRQLNFPRFGLNYLLKHYLNKDVDKQFQLADWRMRPLPEELVNYAREDTHYLLYCYDRLSNELIEASNEQLNLIRAAFSRSRDICLKHYEKPLFAAEDYLRLLETQKKAFTNQQLTALQQLYAWRDKIARLEDESLAYVLPSHMLLQIAEVLPRQEWSSVYVIRLTAAASSEMQGILACCSPVPLLVKQELHELHRIILHARSLPLEAKRVETAKPMETVKRSLNPLVFCPHDLSHVHDGEELTSVLSKGVDRNKPLSPVAVKTKPDLNVFAMTRSQADPKPANVSSTSETEDDIITPYDLYLIAKERDDELLTAPCESGAEVSTVESPVIVETSASQNVVEDETPDAFETEAIPADTSHNYDDKVQPLRASKFQKWSRRKDKRKRKRQLGAQEETGEYIRARPPLDSGCAKKKAKFTDVDLCSNSNVDAILQPYDYKQAKARMFPKKGNKATSNSGCFNPYGQAANQKSLKSSAKSKKVKMRKRNITYRTANKGQRGNCKP